MEPVLPEKREDRRHNEEEERECRNWMGTMLRRLERGYEHTHTRPQQHTYRRELCR